ncbi:sialate:O-sulfotransferase 2-like [Antedon mediterranea]|uniref:sialate:O-sulfotransferase 2-like n=1 Tax=Antedon mediterranea TaxID=105859 RepID=UPI003AF602D4
MKVFSIRPHRRLRVFALLVLLGISIRIISKLALFSRDLRRIRSPKINTIHTFYPSKNDTGIIEFNGKTWMSFTDIDSPGVYRACVPRPSDAKLLSAITGGIIEDNQGMTIIYCLSLCIDRGYTYTALGRGTQCLCGNIQDKDSELYLGDYQDSRFCDTPCGGEAHYSCGGRHYLSIYRTSVPDQRCVDVKLKPEGSLPLVALASYPRSGNTWTRQLIEKSSGIPTGSTMWRSEMKMAISKKVFLGGNINYKLQRTICIKSHSHKVQDIKEFKGAILLIRNPYRTLVAEVFRRLMIVENKNSTATSKYFKSEEWNAFVDVQINDWRDTALNWIKNTPKILVVHYENLEDNTFKEIHRMMDFLNVFATDNRIKCAIQEHPSSKSTGLSLGNHFRKTRVYLTNNPFSDSQKELIDRNIEMVNSTLNSKGLTPLPAYSVTVF